MKTYKPNRTAFLFQTFVLPMVLLLVLALGCGITGIMLVGPWVGFVVGGVWMSLSGVIYAQRRTAYRKEQYEIHPDRIIMRRGGIFSDEEVEVHYANVTYVQWRRNWLRHRFFGTGSLVIHIAGNAGGAILFREMYHSGDVLTEIQQRMRQEFSMSTERLLHEDAPAKRGIILDIPVKIGWGLALILFGIGEAFLESVPSSSETEAGVATLYEWTQHISAWFLLVIPVLALLIAGMILRYLDLKHRTYKVYDGVIEYHEGFLTQNDAFMPVENLSNSEVRRGIVERITNLYNVVVSCQGAGQEVSFLYLVKGPELDAVLDGLIDKNSRVSSKEAVPAVPGLPPPLPVEESVYRMHMIRSLCSLAGYIPLLPLLFFAPYLLLGFAYHGGMKLIRILKTTYTLRQNSVEEKFDFLHVNQREFSNEKITGIVFKENIVDRIFKTITIEFWSIGAGKEIAFTHVPKTNTLVAAVRQRAGIDFTEPVKTLRSEFGLGRHLCAAISKWLVFTILMSGVVGLSVRFHWAYALILLPLFGIAVLSVVYARFYHARSRLDIFKEGLSFSKGLVTRSETCALFPNIKDITTVKIPWHDHGSIRFNVAGERTVENAGATPNGFTVPYLPDIQNIDEWFDYEILACQVEPISTDGFNEMEARKGLGNTAIKTLLTSVILFPMIPLLPITLPLVLWRAHLVRYRIEPGRVLMRKGRLFLKQTSILFNRIDHIEVRQGALNKLFKNGTITISTAGSSKPELVLKDITFHERFYQTLHNKHQGDVSNRKEKSPSAASLP